MSPLARTGALVAVVWTLPLGMAPLATPLGQGVGLALTFGVATALLLATRGEIRRDPEVSPGALVLGLLAGIGSYPAWTSVIGWVGHELGLAPAPAPEAPTTAIGIAAVVLAAPLAEELLYRERVQTLLRQGRWPLPARVGASAALFAAPHLMPWSVLGTALVGVSLALTYEWTRSVGFCVALHVGLNTSSLLPPDAMGGPLPVTIAILAWLLGIGLIRRDWRARHALA